MIFNLNRKLQKSILAFVAVTAVIGSVYTGCGKTDGYSVAGITNTYNFIYFGNYGGSTINAFYLQNDGVLNDIIPNLTLTGTGTANVNDMATSLDGHFLYAANRATNNVSWYTLKAMTTSNPGEVTAAVSGDVTAAGNGVSSIKVHPNGRFAYVTDSSLTAASPNIHGYSINQTSGALTVLGTVYQARSNPWTLAFTPSGSHLFVVNRTTSDITSFSVNATSGALSTVALSTATGGTNPEDVVVSPSGSFLYVLTVGGTPSIFMYSISNGAITALSTPSIAVGTGPKKILMSPNGKYLFVTNNTANMIGVYSVASTGLLTAVTGSPFAGPSGAGVYALGITADNMYLIVSGDTDGKGYVYSLNDTTGAITQVGSGVTLGANPRSIQAVALTTTD